MPCANTRCVLVARVDIRTLAPALKRGSRTVKKRLKPGCYPRLNSGVKSARLRGKGHPAENLFSRRQAGGRTNYFTNYSGVK
eukprot:9471818-Pyramimonas_sp.AAC.1